jgi:hypothetical protein
MRAICAVVASVVVAACGGTRTPASAPPAVTAVEIPESPPRRPDGVVVEPASAVPEASERASSNGVVALREPLGGEAVVAVVRSLFRAFAHEDRDALSALLTADAAPLVMGSSGQARPAHGALLDQWSARLRSLNYGLLAGTEVARVDRIDRYTYGDLEGGSGAMARPEAMRPGDLLVRVPVTLPRVGAEPLFGDVVVLLLRREGDGFKIAGEGEE